MENVYKIEEKSNIKNQVYIQSNTRKSYPNRFLVELIDKVDEYKSPTESRRHFIEDAIIEKLQGLGCSFNKPLTKEERLSWISEVESM